MAKHPEGSSMNHTSKTIRVGMIGAGNWAEYGHIPALKLLPQYELTAIHSRSRDKAQALAGRHGFKHAFTSEQQLVAHPEVDLVLVLNPAPSHAGSIRAAIAAGKDVYSEWPLTPRRQLSQELMALARETGVRHIVGLQRRLGPDYRYVRDLLRAGHIGEIRSVRMHISVEYFQKLRKAALYFTLPEENYSGLLHIYGGHYFDAVFTMLGHPDSIQALNVNQFKEVTLIETGETVAHTLADQVILAGTFGNGAVLLAHIEAGKRNNYGLQIDITGSEGDIRISNTTSFGDSLNVIEAARGDSQPMRVMAVPDSYDWLPENQLGGSQRELANLYAAHASDLAAGTRLAPTFADAMAMHALIDGMEASSVSGRRLQMR
jgi:predicted dehydrogenase